MKIKLESGREIVLNELTVDERDQLLDCVDYDNSKEGVKIKMLHSTMTKFIRTSVKGSDDKFIKSLNFSEKSEIFQKIQGDLLNLGEEEASD
tara:strand:- start:6399 stop:6674 length:276 start_codon:yes stop_codon:yes gene_type:complete